MASAAPAAPVRNPWRRVSPSLVPILAVVTALIVTVPFMMITGGQGDLGRGLNIALTAYSSFIEGSIGVVINEMLEPSDVDLARAFADSGDLSDTELRGLAQDVEQVVAIGAENVVAYADTLNRYADTLDNEAADELGSRIPAIINIGADTLRAMTPLLVQLDELPGAQVNLLIGVYSNAEFSERQLADLETTLPAAATYADEPTLTEEQRAEIINLIPAAAEYSDGDLLNYLQVIGAQGGVVAVRRAAEQLDLLDQLGLTPGDPDAANLAAVAALSDGNRTGAEIVLELAEVQGRLETSGITDEETLSRQLNLVNSMYRAEVLTNPDVSAALATELQPFIENNFVVYRPGVQPLFIVPGETGNAGVVYIDETRPETVYLQLGDRALLFFPATLEQMLVRSIPFIIAGLAVMLGFKAGLFNIGAEGQLYAGGILAVWIGFSPIFDGLPGLLRVALVLMMGIIGGGLWGMIPGALKAFTGAHEVITTIMLNFIAIRLVDWLIRSDNPILFLDPTASTPRTPVVAESARLLRFNELSPLIFIAAGVLVLLLGLWQRRAAIRQNPVHVVRPVVYGLLVALGGLFLAWITVRGVLHIGFIVMLVVVWLVDWFLNRTTPGFEIRTVGANANAAHYAGMNVKWNIILALTLSGALAGLAGAIEISSVQYYMQPAFFAGLGFDAIAVALLARNNPRNMIAAGLLWGALVSGADLMQVRAGIAIDLVKIIQALIIMFIAADVIVRSLWRVPKPRSDEVATATFSKGWGLNTVAVTTQNRVQTDSITFHLPETMTLVCAALILIAVIALPWLVTSASSYTALTFMTQNGVIETSNFALLILVPLAAVVAAVIAVVGLTSPRARLLVRWGIALAGLVGIGYFIGFFFEATRIVTETEGGAVLSGGFWMAFFVMFGLVLQAALPRPDLLRTTGETYIRLPLSYSLLNVQVTRTGVFSLIFTIAGLVLLLVYGQNIAPNARTTLVFRGGLPDAVILTQSFTVIVGVIYLVTGIFGLVTGAVEQKQLQTARTMLLIIDGILIMPVVLIIAAANANIDMTQTLASSFRLATPIAIGALAGIWCERSGVTNIAIEGMMLTGACIGFVTTVLLAPYLPDTQVGLAIGVVTATLAGGLISLLHAWLSITFRTDQVVSGTVINILALGLTSFLRREVLLSDQAARETLPLIEIPVLRDIPIIGEVLFTGKPIFLSMFVLIILTHVVLYFTRWGLRTRAVGENPHAADTLGIDVIRNRYINVVIGGLIAGFAGAWFSLETVGNFDDNMTGGLGFIALAAMIFGKWTPGGAFVGALLFGFSQALNSRFQILQVPIPPQFVQMIPYIVTIVVLAGVVGRAVAPKADGVPYTKE